MGIAEPRLDKCRVARRDTRCYCILDVRCLLRSQIVVCLRQRQKRCTDSNTLSLPADNIARKKSRFLPPSLLERGKEKRPFLDDRPAERRAILNARLGRFFVRVAVDDWSERVAGLDAFISDKSEDIA